jgi:hypothetical protein
MKSTFALASFLIWIFYSCNSLNMGMRGDVFAEQKVRTAPLRLNSFNFSCLINSRNGNFGPLNAADDLEKNIHSKCDILVRIDVTLLILVHLLMGQRGKFIDQITIIIIIELLRRSFSHGPPMQLTYLTPPPRRKHCQSAQ